jgi:hypothetical protein
MLDGLFLFIYFPFFPPAVSVLPLALQLFPDMLDGLLGDVASALARVTASRLRGRQASGTVAAAFARLPFNSDTVSAIAIQPRNSVALVRRF